MGVQKHLVRVGISKQTAKGSPAGTPAAFGVGVMSGSVMDVDIDESPVMSTGTSRFMRASNRSKAVPKSSFSMLSYPKIVGLILERFFGAIATVGPGPVFTHTITSADGGPLYLSLFGRYAADYGRIVDGKWDSLKLEWDESGPLKLSLVLLGTELNPNFGVWTATVDEDELGGWLTSHGGTFNYDGATAKIKSGSIEYSNKAEAVALAASAKPDDIYHGIIEGKVSLTLVPDNLDNWKKAVAGTTAGTSVSQDPLYAAIDLKWIKDANTDLRLQADRVASLVKLPEASPEGGAAEVPMEGVILKPSAGETNKFTLRNDHTAY